MKSSLKKSQLVDKERDVCRPSAPMSERRLPTFFVARYVRVDGGHRYKLDCSAPLEPLVASQSKTIFKISPDFCAIYVQAEEADQRRPALVAGPGYRKAFEFLIKDYIFGEFREKGNSLPRERVWRTRSWVLVLLIT